jgi:transposase
MDNCAFHHRRDVIGLLDFLTISHQFLPPYSPQLNPIEEYFSCSKSKFSSLRPAPSTSIQLREKIEMAIANVNVEFGGWFRHMRVWLEKGLSRQVFN